MNIVFYLFCIDLNGDYIYANGIMIKKRDCFDFISRSYVLNNSVTLHYSIAVEMGVLSQAIPFTMFLDEVAVGLVSV
jgi:hypothetical protein